MANFFKNMNMEFVTEYSEEKIRRFMGVVCSEGNPICGYYNLPYFNHHFKDAQVIIQTEKNENGDLEIARMDTHVSGNCVWTLSVRGIDFDPKDALKTQKRCIFNTCDDGSGLLVINIVNADVLPSYMEDDEITLQMVAYAEEIDYFASEEEYEAILPRDELGRTFGIDNGTLFPSGFMRNHSVRPGEELSDNVDDWSDNYMLVKGEVKGFRRGRIEDTEDSPEFIRCIIDTKYGELEIVHDMDSVIDEQRENLRKGSIVSAIVYLSGDVAIYDYENGIVKDEEHNLRALRYSITGGDASRITSILADDVEYVSEVTNKTFIGKEDVVSRIDYVNKNAGQKYYSYLATITDIKDGDDELDYQIGKRCVILARGEEDNYESILFVECNDEGNIKRMVTSNESRYCFNIDEPEYKKNFEKLIVPETYSKAMVSRAIYHDFTYGEIDEIVDTIEVKPSYQEIATGFVEQIEETNEDEIKEVSKNAFGYLFAKGMERTISKSGVGYAFGDIKNDTFTDNMCESDSKKLQSAYKYGKQFFTDFSLYQSNEEDKETYYKEMVSALTFVQAMGVSFAHDYMNKDFSKVD